MSDADRAALPRTLIVDDQKEVADAYALRLDGFCDVETVYGGQEALSAVESRPVDVVLLDRHMPGMSGDEVLERFADRGFDGRVIMVTAVDPGFDVLDMPFDDYLCKPVEREDLRTAIDQQCTVLGYELLGAYFGAESKRAVLEAELPEAERADDPRYSDVEETTRRLGRRIRRLLEDPQELIAAFDGVDREGR
jgi:CheY-like chemotaxis protein